MGNVRFGAPRKLIAHLHKAFMIPTFVETGTFQGGTASWASEVFGRVITIEGSPEYHRAAQENHRARTNITFLQGDSRRELSHAIALTEGEATLFWLDAHWMPEAFGVEAECPVLDEIRLIGADSKNFILIDDARLFLAPPPKPHRHEDWPDIMTILTALAVHDRYTVIQDDVIVSVPAEARETLREYCQEQVPEPWTPTLRDRLSLFVRKFWPVSKP